MTSPLYTGRQVVVLSPRQESTNLERILTRITGLSNIARTRDFESQALEVSVAENSQATIFDELGVAVVDVDPDQRAALVAAAGQGGEVASVEPELIHHALTATALPTVAAPVDNDEFTWGLQATGAATSTRTGRGIRVAVLDTGFDVAHPDFAGRTVTTQSFITGESVRDAHGHGTHCIGTSCGSAHPDGTRRYGVATEAEIYAGKVLSNSGSGTDTGILAGINWAVANGCKVISMSLGADVRQVSNAYETVGKRALDRGTLIIAAAGNNADRPDEPGFVGVPANSPSIMAIAAVDSDSVPAQFSARTNPVDGGKIDLAGPGVNVYSSWPMPQGHRSISGTSMATPHVSGIAALWAETTGHEGRALWTVLVQNARPLDIATIDVGAGLVQAPQ